MRALKAIAIAAGFGIVFSTAAPSQMPVRSNLALMANDHYTRSHDYDLIHQKIAISHFNWDSASFDGVVTTTLVGKNSGITSIEVDEGPLLVNSRVTDRAGRPMSTARHGDSLVISLREPLKFNDTLLFTIAYHGRVEGGHGLTFITNDGLAHRPDQIWSQGEDHDNHFWFPTYDFPNDKMTWELSATVPAADLAISNGRLLSNVVTGKTRTMNWTQEKPSASYLVSLVVAPLAVTHDTWEGIPVDYYTYHEDSALARPLFRVTPDMIGTYSRLTGIRYPWAKYAQTTVADFFGGMENVSATTLVDWLPNAEAYRDRPWYQHILIPHELAHQWFGDYVTTQNWANMWLNEGFAEFMPGQYWGDKLGRHAEQDYYDDEYHQFMGIESQRSMPLASLGSNNIYPKGALVLEMLKNYLGPDRFWAAVHLYLTTHAFSTATSDDMRQAVMDATGENLDWFWDQWIYSSGLPRFTVKAAYDAGSARLTLNVAQTQVDSFKVDSTGRLFNVPSVFRMPVAIRIGFDHGDMMYHTTIDSREQTIVIDSVKTAPSMVIFDDGNHILKTLNFEQPTAWLAQQLQRDPDLWDREWAIGQLAQHQSDKDATFALTEAVKRSDYFLTRVQAIEALAGFPATTAMGSLGDAMQDTSAAVRAAAMNAMAHFPTSTVADFARNAIAHDSSYEVQAAAVVTLSRADPTHAHDAVVRALHSHSYQSVVENAAMRVIGQAGDTAMIGAVDSAVTSGELASHVLALFAARGNAHAVAIVTAHLNDSRAAIRGWTVSAVQGTMAAANKAAALTLLKGTVEGIRYRNTQDAVRELIKTLEKP